MGRAAFTLSLFAVVFYMLWSAADAIPTLDAPVAAVTVSGATR